MKILVTGASSFVGAHFCSLAVRKRMDVLGLWRRTPLSLQGVRSLQGDVRTLQLSQLPPGVDMVVHIAAKVMADDAEAQNRAMLDRVLSWGKPVIYASSTVVHWPRQNAYARCRILEERRIRESGLPWLIVRPCAPYGPWHPEHTPSHRESMQTLAGIVNTLPVVPLIGDGKALRQPVHVEDFSSAICALMHAAAADASKWNRAFDAGGAEALTLKEIIHVLADHAGRKVRTLPIPSSIARRMLAVVPGFHPDVASTFDTDDVVDPRPLQEATGVAPRSFRDGAWGILWGS